MSGFAVCLFTVAVWTLSLNYSSALPPVFDIDVLIKILYIPSNTRQGTAIYRLRARDLQSVPDYPITFTLAGSGRSYFSVKTVGQWEANLILNVPLTNGHTYSLTITATDKAREVTSTEMQVNATGASASPALVFLKYPQAPIVVAENVRRGLVIARLEARKNSNTNRYPQVTLTGSTKFDRVIQLAGRDTITVEVVIREVLDHQQQDSYTLTITALEGYRAAELDTRNIIVLPLTVTVQAIQAPVFSHLPLLTKIPADKKVGDIIFTIKASEGNKTNPASVNYRIQGQYSRFFKVESGGKLTVAAPLNELLVNCQDSPILLDVRADDIGTRASTTSEVVVLVQNPAASTVAFNFNTFRTTVNENAPINTVLVFPTPPQVTNQLDCGIIQLELHGINGLLAGPATFDVKPNILFKSGAFQIWVKDRTLLDYEDLKEIQFEVTARNLRVPQSAVSRAVITVAINDLNDNVPLFNEQLYHATIPENALQNTFIAQVTANDADSGKFGTIRYTNVRSNGPLSGNLHLNRETGQITLTSTNNVLDREKQARHIITVEAQDNEGSGGNIKSAEIQVDLQDVNDNAPTFSRSHFYLCLPDSLRKGEVFWTAHAMDADEPNTRNSIVQYETITTNNLFQMSTVGGMSLTRDASGILRSQDTDLHIRARDMGTPVQNSQATVHISWDKRTCHTHVVEYLVDAQANTVRSKQAQMERLLTDLNGGAHTKIESITEVEGSQSVFTVAADSDTSNNVARTKIIVTVLQHGNSSMVDLTALARFNQGEV